VNTLMINEDINIISFISDIIFENFHKYYRKYKVVHSIENDSDSVRLLLGSAQIPSTVQWEITQIVQSWNSYRALQIKET
jgi:hypothetical protein